MTNKVFTDAPNVNHYLGRYIARLGKAAASGNEKASELHVDFTDQGNRKCLEDLLVRFSSLVPEFERIWTEIGNPSPRYLPDRVLQALAEVETIEVLVDKLNASDVRKLTGEGKRPDFRCQVEGSPWCVEVTCLERPSTRSGLTPMYGDGFYARTDQAKFVDALARKIDEKVGQFGTCDGLRAIVIVAGRPWAASPDTEHAVWLMLLNVHAQEWLDQACDQARIRERGINRVYLRPALNRWFLCSAAPPAEADHENRRNGSEDGATKA